MEERNHEELELNMVENMENNWNSTKERVLIKISNTVKNKINVILF